MRVYRSSKVRHVPTALQGFGAALTPGRWHNAGVRVGYTAASASLSMLEILVHIDRENVPEGLRMLAFEVPDDAVFRLPEDEWPEGWSELPYSDVVRAVGDAFIREGRHLAMLVPSAVVRGEFNVLINPQHERFAEIQQVSDEPLEMDPRLFGSGPRG